MTGDDKDFEVGLSNTATDSQFNIIYIMRTIGLDGQSLQYDERYAGLPFDDLAMAPAGFP